MCGQKRLKRSFAQFCLQSKRKQYRLMRKRAILNLVILKKRMYLRLSLINLWQCGNHKNAIKKALNVFFRVASFIQYRMICRAFYALRIIPNRQENIPMIITINKALMQIDCVLNRKRRVHMLRCLLQWKHLPAYPRTTSRSRVSTLSKAMPSDKEAKHFAVSLFQIKIAS